MVFSSLVFLFIFFPIVFIVYNLLPKPKTVMVVDDISQDNIIGETDAEIKKKNKLKINGTFTARNIFLLVVSLIFYAWGGYITYL